jgi:hypothetical protein
MPINLNDDILLLLDVDDFAVSGTFTKADASSQSTILGIFDNETVPVEAGGFTTVHEQQPRFTCRTSDIPTVAEGDTLLINSVTYTIRAWVHDGTGVTTLQLEVQ